MLYRNLGKTSQKISILGFGCMRLPIIDGMPDRINEPLASEMLHHAIDQGVNYIDTAYPYHGTSVYGGGMSEIFVGNALKDGYRDQVYLSTKLPSWLIQKKEDMNNYLDEQLKRLQTDKIDFYFNDVLILNSIKLTSNESAGATGVSVSIIRENDNFLSLTSTSNVRKSISVKPDRNNLKVIYKGKNFKYQIHKDKGIYIMVEKNKENVIFTQYKKRPVFD